MRRINFFTEQVQLNSSFLKGKKKLIAQLVQEEGREIEEMNFIFCTDDYLLQINQKHLNHDYFTDVITFDNSLFSGDLVADIFISLERVEENAHEMGVSVKSELTRVMIHGALHLCGYSDKTPSDIVRMRAKEDHYLSLLSK